MHILHPDAFFTSQEQSLVNLSTFSKIYHLSKTALNHDWLHMDDNKARNIRMNELGWGDIHMKERTNLES